MKKLLFILLIFPIIAQELMINSFDSDEDFDEDYWILDFAEGNEFGYANYSEASISHDQIGAIQFDYSIHNSVDFGGYTKLSHFHPDPNSVYDLSDFNAISFWFYNEAPASLEGRTEIRFVLFDISTSADNNVYSDAEVEYFYSFHFDILDQQPGWNKVEIPLTGTNIPDQNLPYNFGFNNTGWNGIPGDGTLNLDAIKGFAIEFFVNNPADVSDDVVSGTFTLDELKAENVEFPEPEDVNITFQVDMSNQNINPACPPSLAGGWNGWNWPYTLEEGQNNIWSTQITLNPGVEYEYKFGNCGWELEDLEPGLECTNTTGVYTNRIIDTPSQDTILEPVCFGTCDPECPQAEYVNVTFQVNTNNNDPGFDEQCDMFIVGSFQQPFQWDIVDLPISLDQTGNDGTWSITRSLLAGTYIEYKFASCEGSDAFIENNIEICDSVQGCSESEGNRYLTVPYEDVVLEPVYFNSCKSENEVYVTFQVDMSNEEVGGGDGLCGVHIGATFNYFSWWEDELLDCNNDDIWEIQKVLEPGSFIEYKFANCGDFGIESVPDTCGFGQDLNRSLTVPDSDMIINPVCLGSCSEECGELTYSNVTFSVDMTSVDTATSGVFVSGAGALQGPSGVELYDEDNDDIWSTTISLAYGDYNYKFRNGYYAEWEGGGWEEPQGNCFSQGPDLDRLLIVDQPTITLDTACFGSCETCSTLACNEANGDVNEDGLTNVLDLVVIINSIVNQTEFTDYESCASDVNGDDQVNVLDVVIIVNLIISG